MVLIELIPRYTSIAQTIEKLERLFRKPQRGGTFPSTGASCFVLKWPPLHVLKSSLKHHRYYYCSKKRWVSRQPRERFKPDLTKAETLKLRRTSPTQRYILLGDEIVEKRASKNTERDSSRYFHQSIHASPQINHKRDNTFPMLLPSQLVDSL